MENNLTNTFIVLVTVGIGHGVYRKFYTLIGGQRAKKFENQSLIFHPLTYKVLSLKPELEQNVTICFGLKMLNRK